MNTTIYWIGQALGVIPVVLSFFTYFYNSRNKTIWFKLFADLTSSIHFFMIGAWSGMAICFLNVFRNYLFANKDKHWPGYRTYPYIFLALNFVCTVLTARGWVSVLPLIGSSLAILGFWCDAPRQMRKFTFPGIGLWLIYSICVLSISGIISNTLSLSAMTIAECKSRREQKVN